MEATKKETSRSIILDVKEDEEEVLVKIFPNDCEKGYTIISREWSTELFKSFKENDGSSVQ